MTTTAVPSIAKDLSLTPQSKTVLRHLERRGTISPMEALMGYSITRLAACIYEIRQAGYNITSTFKRDENGHKYTRYVLPK
jgi:hypothetical protein